MREPMSEGCGRQQKAGRQCWAAGVEQGLTSVSVSILSGATLQSAGCLVRKYLALSRVQARFCKRLRLIMSASALARVSE